LLYDAKAYGLRAGEMKDSAADPGYIGRLQSAGATPVVMPSEVAG
jgi:hypothetical protein